LSRKSFALHESGVKTFPYIYTFKGTRKHLYLGKHPFLTLAEAKVEYNEAYNKVRAGENPAEDHKTAPATQEMDPTSFGHFADLYMKWSAANHALAWYKTVPTLKPAIKKRVLSDGEIRHVWQALGNPRSKVRQTLSQHIATR